MSKFIWLFAYRIMNNTIAQKHITTANTENMFDSSATDTSIAVIATIIVFKLTCDSTVRHKMTETDCH